MRDIATTTTNVTSLPTAAKPQTAKDLIAVNVKLLIEQLEAGNSEGLWPQPQQRNLRLL